MSPRGFSASEFRSRLTRAQAYMTRHGLAALLLTTEPEVRYFTGYLTRFWESPTRPWFLIVPATGSVVAVIPSIGAPLMARAGVADIRTWSAPNLADDGVTLLAETLKELVPSGERIGVPDGHETHLRMPLADFERVRELLGSRKLVGDAGILRRMRMTKSDAEIAKIEQACAIAGRAFARVPEIARAGVPLEDVFRRFQMLCLEEGADWVPYLAGGAGPEGYDDVISPASPRPLAQGDVLMLDTGLVWDGYFCDFDRNWSIGRPSSETREVHGRLIDATRAAFEIAAPGRTAADLHAAMSKVLGGETGAGRLGHGLGMSLTEWPSLIPSDTTVLEPGMVLTLEPGLDTATGVLVHEENIVITATGARYLSPVAPVEVPVL